MCLVRPSPEQPADGTYETWKVNRRQGAANTDLPKLGRQASQNPHRASRAGLMTAKQASAEGGRVSKTGPQCSVSN